MQLILGLAEKFDLLAACYVLPKAKCIPRGCPFVRSDVLTVAPTTAFYFKRKDKAGVSHSES